MTNMPVLLDNSDASAIVTNILSPLSSADVAGSVQTAHIK